MGIATHVTGSAHLESIEKDIIQGAPANVMDAYSFVDRVIRNYAGLEVSQQQRDEIAAMDSAVSKYFHGKSSVEDIISSLKTGISLDRHNSTVLETEIASSALKTLLSVSPTSLKLTFEQVNFIFSLIYESLRFFY